MGGKLEGRRKKAEGQKLGDRSWGLVSVSGRTEKDVRVVQQKNAVKESFWLKEPNVAGRV
jgi:hypothetical protein